MEKEIEILDFVIKEQNKRNIEKGMINSNQVDPLNNKILEQVELQKRSVKNNNINIFHELDETNRVHEENIKEQKKQNKNIVKVYAGIVLASIVLVTSAIKYENKPIRVTVREMAADSGLYLTDDGRKINGKMTQEELVDYAIKHNLTMEQLDAEITKFCNKEWLAEDVVREKMEETNPEVFKNIR